MYSIDGRQAVRVRGSSGELAEHIAGHNALHHPPWVHRGCGHLCMRRRPRNSGSSTPSSGEILLLDTLVSQFAFDLRIQSSWTNCSEQAFVWPCSPCCTRESLGTRLVYSCALLCEWTFQDWFHFGGGGGGGGGIRPPLIGTKEVLCVQGNSKWYREYDRETMVQRFQETGFACYDMCARQLKVVYRVWSGDYGTTVPRDWVCVLWYVRMYIP